VNVPDGVLEVLDRLSANAGQTELVLDKVG
jgi:hypothetical protein